MDKDNTAGCKSIEVSAPDLGPHSHFVTHAITSLATMLPSISCFRFSVGGINSYSKYAQKLESNLMPVIRTNNQYAGEHLKVFALTTLVNEIHLAYLMFKNDSRFESSLVNRTIIPSMISLFLKAQKDNGELCLSIESLKNYSAVTCFQYLLIIIEDLGRNELIRVIDNNPEISTNIGEVIMLANEEVVTSSYAEGLVNNLRVGINIGIIKISPKDAAWSMGNLIDARNGCLATKIRRSSKVLTTL